MVINYVHIFEMRSFKKLFSYIFRVKMRTGIMKHNRKATVTLTIAQVLRNKPSGLIAMGSSKNRAIEFNV